MSSLLTVRLETERSATAVKDIVNKADGRSAVNGLIDLLSGAVNGVYNAKLDLLMGAEKASGSFALSSVIATDVCSINGVNFTCVASGATGNQFNVGADDAATAVNLAAAINASVTALVTGVVTAEASDESVIITADTAGLIGNSIAIASADATIVASGARLTGGTDGTTKTVNLGLA